MYPSHCFDRTMTTRKSASRPCSTLLLVKWISGRTVSRGCKGNPESRLAIQNTWQCDVTAAPLLLLRLLLLPPPPPTPPTPLAPSPWW